VVATKGVKRGEVHLVDLNSTRGRESKVGHIVLDRVRTVDRDRLVRNLGRISPATLKHVLTVLQEMFEP